MTTFLSDSASSPWRPALSLTILFQCLGFAFPCFAAGEETAPEADVKPITTDDTGIPADYLKLMVQPLTLEEVTVEVDAWRDLVKEKTTELNSAEIASRSKRQEVDAIEKAADAAKEAEQADGADGAEASEKAEEAQAAAREAAAIQQESEKQSAVRAAEEKAVQEQGADDAARSSAAVPDGADGAEKLEQSAAANMQVKGAILESLTKLREERTALIERLNVVLADFEEKGGDPEPYKKYISAVSGINVDATDTVALWTAIRGWLISSEGGIKWLQKLLTFLVIVFGFYLLAILAGKLVRKATSMSGGMSELMRDFINRMVRRIVVIAGIVVALGAVGFNVGAMLALIGGGAFIIGFALQDTLGNLANGIMLLFHRPFDTGDAVEVAGIAGKVESVNLVSTHILTPDNKLMIVPNKKVWGDIITNATGSAQRRVDLIFGIGYGDSIDEAQEVLEEIVGEHELVLKDPAPVIQVHELADSSVNFVCRPWVKTADYWTVYWDITRAVKQSFDKRGISIPFPQQDVHVHQVGNGDS
jgi:small conductance mechanosensitive channel